MRATRSNTLLLLAIAVLLFVPGSGFAEETRATQATADSVAATFEHPDQSLPIFDSTTSVETYLAVAMKRSPKLRAAYNRWYGDLKNSDYAGSLPDPMFTYMYFVEQVETRVGPQEHRFGLRQAFPWFGTLGAKEDMADAMSQASYQNFEAARLALAYEIKAAYYDYYYLGQDLLITRENFELLSFWESVARSKYKVGLKQHPDVIKAQVELGMLEDRIRSLEEQAAPKAARLRALLHLPDSVNLPIPRQITVAGYPLSADSIIAAVRKRNPNLQAMARLVNKAQAGERLAGKQALPSFSIGVDYIVTGEALNPEMLDSGKDPWMIGAGISLPIWFGKNNARKDEARARRAEAEYRRADAEDQLVAMAERILFEYSDALRKTQLYRDGLVPKAEQSLNANYAAYQSGEADFLNVLDAQRQLLNFQLTVAREQSRLATKRAELEMLSGAELTQFSTNKPLEKE